MRLQYGKAKVEIISFGCISCGTIGSHGWEVARTLRMVIDKREYEIAIHICADCKQRKEGLLISENELQVSLFE